MTVTVFTTSNCRYCDMAKAWLKEKGIEYKERNVDEDWDARDDMIMAGTMTAPLIKFQVDEEVSYVYGFEPGKMAEKLGLV